MELKLPSEWEEIDGIRIHDPDGWRQNFVIEGNRYPAQAFDIPISREEWDARSGISTVSGRRKQ